MEADEKNLKTIYDPITGLFRNRCMILLETQPRKYNSSPSRVSHDNFCTGRTSSDELQSVNKNAKNGVVNSARDLELIQKEQDVEAFERLFNNFAPKVKGFLMKSGTDNAMADECVQEVMATVWNTAHLFDPSRASASTWIFTIARNKKIDAIRKQKRPEPEDLGWGPEHEPDQEAVIGLQQETAKLGQAIATLPEKQRSLLERAYYSDMSHSEIAAATGLPLGTIKSRIRLALDRLRHAMK